MSKVHQSSVLAVIWNWSFNMDQMGQSAGNWLHGKIFSFRVMFHSVGCNFTIKIGWSSTSSIRGPQRFYSWCPLHRDSAEILQFAAETCLSMSTTNHFISLSHGETVNGNTLSGVRRRFWEIVLCFGPLPVHTLSLFCSSRDDNISKPDDSWRGMTLS